MPSFLGKVEEEDSEVVDSNVLPYCSIDQKQKKSLGELEQDFLQAMQVLHQKLPVASVEAVKLSFQSADDDNSCGILFSQD